MYVIMLYYNIFMDNHEKHSLGPRALILFLFKRIKVPIFLFLLTGASWYGQKFVSGSYADWADYGTRVLFVISITYSLLVFFKTYLEYRHYTYTFTDEAFIMTFGYFISNEIAGLYHQIQNVNIKRSPLDRLMGVSQVVILMIGTERETHKANIILPGVGKGKAKLVQKELLVRARKHTVPASSL